MSIWLLFLSAGLKHVEAIPNLPDLNTEKRRRRTNVHDEYEYSGKLPAAAATCTSSSCLAERGGIGILKLLANQSVWLKILRPENMKFGPKTVLLNKAWGSVVANLPFAAPCFRLDLADLKDVKAFKNRFTSQDYGFLVASDAPWKFTAGSCVGLGKRIDVLMNNAGVMAIPERQETKDPKKNEKKTILESSKYSIQASKAKYYSIFSTWRTLPGALQRQQFFLVGCCLSKQFQTQSYLL